MITGKPMKPFDNKNVPRCTIDYPLEITPAEIAPLTSPINTLLKSTYLLGCSRDVEDTFQSLFDLAEEIAGVDCSAYISGETYGYVWEIVAMRHISRPDGNKSPLFAPAAISRT